MNTKSVVKPRETQHDSPDYILFKFDSLQPGNGFVIHEDNDPHSIYFQMLKEKGDTFSWEYLAVGPKKWSIKISKKENDNGGETLGQMALSDNRKAVILRKYGLDYSFKGNRTLKDACAQSDISTKNVERELAASGQQSLIYTINYTSWELDYLADFIIANHHQYTRKTLAAITNELDNNLDLIHKNHASLLPLVEAFRQLSITMNIIMQQEEQVLFPYIRFLAQVTRGKILGDIVLSGSVRDHINKIESEQRIIGRLVEYIRTFTSKYTMPRIGDTFYVQALQWLNELDNDLHQHVHIENNILFRKALLLEHEYITNAPTYAASEKNKAVNNHLSSLL